MCGIVGAAGALGYTEEDIFTKLLKLSTFRGEDSTGVIEVDLRNRLSVQKCLGGPWNLNRGTGYQSPAIRLSALVGHTRYATIGKINEENTHPFEFDNVVGVHNGTIKYGLKYEKQYGSDSQALYHELNECNSFSEMEMVLGKIVGAYTLVWWDKNKNLLNFVRNNERPLWFMFPGKKQEKGDIYYTETDQYFYWASEKRMLTFLGNRVFEEEQTSRYSTWKYWSTQQEPYTPMYIELPTNEIWSFKVDGSGYKLVTQHKFKPKVTKIITAPPVVNNKLPTNGEGFFSTLTKGYKGILISADKIKDLMAEYSKKCSFCGEAMKEQVFWAAPDVPICHDCSTQSETAH